MIICGHLIVESTAISPPDRVSLIPGYIVVENGRIVHRVLGESPESWDFGGPDSIISPGFIDAHVHLPQFDMLGAHGLPLLQWLSSVTFQHELRWADVDVAFRMTERVIQQCYSHGTTAIYAYATSHHDSTLAALKVAERAGMRGAIGQILMDRNAPPALLQPASDSIEQTYRLLDAYPPSHRLAAAITPRFAITCSEELLAAAGEVAEQTGAIVQTHLAETIPECEQVRQLFDGKSYVDVYQEAGLVTPRSVFGHGIHLDASELSALSKVGARIAHCPTANSFLRSGTMNRREHSQNGVSLALGSDIGAGYERSMVRVARAMIEAAASLSDLFPDAGQAWWHITYGNARALHWTDIDRLGVGNPADLVIITPTIPWHQPPIDPLSMLMFAWDDRWIAHTMVRGEIKYSASNESGRER